MNITTQYDIGQVLYIIHDTECMERLCTSIKIMPNKLIVYELSLGTSTSWHFEFEVSNEVDICRKLNLK